ncbi:MAG: helix-turn-helix domain-containing protein [Hyphomicrobium sp.]|jgi:hypothetical protein
MTAESSGLAGRCLGYFAATTFIAASASQNALHGWQLGLRTSEITATIFAAASIAGAIMCPIAVAAAFRAFRHWEIGKGVVAALLAACCFCYAVVSSVGFVSGARDQASASRTADADAYTLAKARSDAAVTELKTLADVRTTRAAKRRAELEKTIEGAAGIMGERHGAGQADPTASAIVTYASALGFGWKAGDLAPWLSLLAVVFFELGAAASLIVVTPSTPKPAEASAPAPLAAPQITEAEPIAADLCAPVRGTGGPLRRGRKPAKPRDVILQRIEKHGGRLEGSTSELGDKLGLSKSSAHRALHALAAAGLITMATSPAGTVVQAIGQRV